MFGRAIDDVARFYRSGWWYSALLQLASGVLVAVPLAIVAQLAALVMQARGESASSGSLRGFAVVLLAVALVICLPLALVGVSATIRSVNDALAGRRRRPAGAFAEGFRRLPAVVAAAGLGFAGVFALVVLAPVITVLGIIALVPTVAVVAARRRRADLAPWWPTRRLLVWAIVPLGFAARFAVAAIFAVPAVVLEGRGPLEGLRAGRVAARPRRLRVLALVVLGLLATVVLQVAASLLGSLVHGVAGLAVQLVVQLPTVALPLVLVTVLFRLARRPDTGGTPSPNSPYRTGVVLPAPRPRLMPGIPRPVRRVAMVMPFVVVIAALGFAPSAAQAATSSTTLTVNSSADPTDAATLGAEAADCANGAGTCTLRAALQQAQQDASTDSAVRIAFSGSYTIALSAPLTFDTNAANDGAAGSGGDDGSGEDAPSPETPGQETAPSPETPGGDEPTGSGEESGGDEGSGSGSGTLQIDGSGHRIVLDGQNATQAMVLRSSGWAFELTGLQFSQARVTGDDGLGGALSIDTQAPSSIDDVTFDHDAASIGGGAVTMVHGPLAITNSTFAGDSAGSGSNPNGYPLGGADVYTEYGAQVTIRDSTFADYQGVSLFNWAAAGGSTIDVSDSLFDRGDATGILTCSGGGFTGVTNVVGGTDTSCPGTVANPVAAVGDLVVPPQGGPSVLPLVPVAENTALGGVGAGGVECATTDQRGLARPTVACDAGAVEIDPTTRTTLTASSTQSKYGAPLTLTATVVTADGGVSIGSGSVQFEVDGTALGSPVAVTAGAAATTTTTVLAGDHTVSATYLPTDTGMLAGSTSSGLAHSVTASGTLVFLQSSQNPTLAGDGATVTAMVTSPGTDSTPTGPVELVDTTGGQPGSPIATVSLTDGSAVFDLSSLAPGRHDLVAEYAGDGGDAAASSTVLQQVVQTPSTVTAQASVTDIDYGKSTTVSAAVSTTGTTPPTGTVTFAWSGGSRDVAIDSTGSASTAIDDIATGTSQITVTYDGDDRYAVSAATPITVHVASAETTTTLTPADDAAAYGVPDTLTAVVARTSGAAPTGAVAFSVDGTELAVVSLAPGSGSSATATWTPTPEQLPVGDDSVVAVYRPSAGYTPSTSSELLLGVVPAEAVVAIATSDSSSAVGTPVTLTATASALHGSLGVPDGSVVFSVDGTAIGTATLTGGVATITHVFASSGAHSVTAKYSGSTSFADASAPTFTQHTAADSTVTTLTIAPGSSSPRGTPLQFGITVTGAASGLGASGSVAVTDGSDTVATVTLHDGSASGTIPAPGSGAHAYVAVFTPSTADFTTSTSKTIAYTVGAASTTTTLAFSQPSSSQGDPVTLTATVAAEGATPDGSVAFSTGDARLGSAPLVAGPNGTATATLTVALPQSADYPGGQRDVVAVYSPPTDSTDFVASTATVPYTVARGTVALSLELEGTTAGEPQSLVAIVTTLTGTGHPDGTVQFSGAASGTVSVVNGVAVLSGVHLAPGTPMVQAVYTSVDRDFDLPDPAFVLQSFTVSPGTPTVSIATDASGPVSYGSAVRLTATVGTNGSAPTGAVDFTATGTAGTIDLGTASLGGTAPYTATLSTRAIPVGTQSISARYLGDGDFASVASDGIAVSMTPTSTKTALTVTPATSQAGQALTFSAAVTASTTAVARGTVQFAVNGTVVGTVAVGDDGTAALQWTPTAPGSVTATVRYSDAEGGFGESSDTAAHTIDKVPVALQLHTFTFGAFVGGTVYFDVTLQSGGAAGMPMPTGAVTVDDQQGDSCVATLSVSNLDYSELVGGCYVTFTSASMPTFTASYAGDSLYAPKTSDGLTLLVSRSATTASLTSSPKWIAGSTVDLNWKVTGPTTPGASITIHDGSTVICSSTALSGTCSYVVPTGRAEVLLGLTYDGSAAWTGVSALLDEVITTCVVYTGATVYPAGAGTVTMDSAPDCGATGYLPGDYLHFQATAADGYTFRSWGSPDQTSSSYYAQLLYPSYHANAYFDRACVQVQFSVIGGDASRYGGEEIENATAPNCPAGWIGADRTSQTGAYQVGTAISLKAVPPVSTQPEKLYGWSGLAAGADTTSPTQTYIVTSNPDQVLTATFGVSCVHDIQVIQPDGGTIDIDGPNCTDDIGPGYSLGSTIGVRTHSTSDRFYAGWPGSGHPLSSTSTSATGVYTVQKTNSPITVKYDQCLSFTVSVPGVTYLGDGNDISNGTAAATPSGNCPNHGAGWYVKGSVVNVSTTGTRGETFGGWQTSEPFQRMASSTDNYFTLQDSGTAIAEWYAANQCKPYSLAAVPAGYLTVSATFQEDQSCPDGQMNSAISFSGEQATLTATANGGDPLLGWTGTTTRWKDRDNTVDQTIVPTAVNPLTIRMASGGSFTGWACEAIATTLTLVSPNGTSHSEPLPSDGDWVGSAPGPDCPIANDAYTLGQDIFPQASADPVGYTFLGWTGAITSTSLYPTQSISIDGAANSVPLTASYKVNCFHFTTNTDDTAVSPAPNCPDTAASQNMYVGDTQITLQTTGDSGKNTVFRGFTGDADGQSGDYAWLTITHDSAAYSDYTTRSVGETLSNVASIVGNNVAIAAKKAVGVAAAALAGFVMGDNPVLLAASLAVLIGEGVNSIASYFGLQSAGLTAFSGGIQDVSQMLTFIQAGATCASVWSAAGSTTSAVDANNTLSGATGTVAAKAYIADTKKAAAATEAARATQSAAMTAAYNARLSAQLSTATDETSSVTKYLSAAVDSVSAKATAIAEKAKGPLAVAGKLGDTALIASAAYQQFSSGSSGWDDSAASAWTTGGDVYMQCLTGSLPSFFGAPTSGG